MLFNLIFSAFVLMLAWVVFDITQSIGHWADEIMSIRAITAFFGWLIVVMIWLILLFDSPAVGMSTSTPWPYVFAGVCMVIPALNSIKVTSAVVIFSVVVFILKIYWKYQS